MGFVDKFSDQTGATLWRSPDSAATPLGPAEISGPKGLPLAPAQAPTASPAEASRAEADSEPRPIAWEALAYLQSITDFERLQAAVLCCFLNDVHAHRLVFWREATTLISDAEDIQFAVESLGLSLRLPWFENAVRQLAQSPSLQRNSFLLAANRMLRMAKPIRSEDWLLFFGLRRLMGEHYGTGAEMAADLDVLQLPPSKRKLLDLYCAHLAQCVPNRSAADSMGQRWYVRVVSNWARQERASLPSTLDADRLLEAIGVLCDLPIAQRLLIAKVWAEEAVALSGSLTDSAAEVLRLSCLIMDCGMPRVLSRRFENLATPKAQVQPEDPFGD